jgi:hypothetical protein
VGVGQRVCIDIHMHDGDAQALKLHDKRLPLFPDDVKNLIAGAEKHSSLISLSSTRNRANSNHNAMVRLFFEPSIQQRYTHTCNLTSPQSQQANKTLLKQGKQTVHKKKSTSNFILKSILNSKKRGTRVCDGDGVWRYREPSHSFKK